MPFCALRFRLRAEQTRKSQTVRQKQNACFPAFFASLVKAFYKKASTLNLEKRFALLEREGSVFDSLEDLYSELEAFEAYCSAQILENFCAKGEAKFNKTTECTRRRNLSSTATCVYTGVEFSNLWDESEDKKFGFEKNFDSLENYWDSIVRVLGESNISPIETPDEFSVLNVLSMLKKIRDKIVSKTKEKKLDENLIQSIIGVLCLKFIDNQFAFGERDIHPIIYYKFMRILEDWQDELSAQLKLKLTNKLKKKYAKARLEKYKDKQGIVNCFAWFFDKLCQESKYEMYRQIALHDAGDKTLFDAKQLVYSLLTVLRKERNSNNLIVSKALEIVFKEQLNTGLLPIGHVVDNDFVVKKATIYKREVSASPLVLSFECFNDMLSEECIQEELKKYQENLKLAYDWAKKRLRKNPNGKYQGWYSEYESVHVPESWVSAHILLFYKRYSDFLSVLMSDISRKDLQAKKMEGDEDIRIYDTYGINHYIEYMEKNDDCHSVLVFGPRNTEKSAVAKRLAQRLALKYKTAGLSCDYVELASWQFLSEGSEKIMQRTDYIFKRLKRVKRTVLFFDEADQLLNRPEEGESDRISTALLAKIAELGKRKDIRFILSTGLTHAEHMMTPDFLRLGVDPAMLKLGKFDLILPLGSIYWRERIAMLKKAAENIKNPEIKEKSHWVILKEIDCKKIEPTVIKDQPQFEEIEKFLRRTNYMSLDRINQIIAGIFGKDDETALDLYDMFFCGDNAGFKNLEESEFLEFHVALSNLKGMLSRCIKLPASRTMRFDAEKMILENVF
jgi:hypothetical protein